MNSRRFAPSIGLPSLRPALSFGSRRAPPVERPECFLGRSSPLWIGVSPATQALRALTSNDSTASARRRPLRRSDLALSLRIYVAVCPDPQTAARALRPAEFLRHARSRDLGPVLDDMPARRLQAQRLAHRRGAENDQIGLVAGGDAVVGQARRPRRLHGHHVG